MIAVSSSILVQSLPAARVRLFWLILAVRLMLARYFATGPSLSATYVQAVLGQSSGSGGATQALVKAPAPPSNKLKPGEPLGPVEAIMGSIIALR
jgi:hypothetical protein